MERSMHPEAKREYKERNPDLKKSGFLSFTLLAGIVSKINFGFWELPC